MNRQSQSGIALITTLIFLTLVTFIAVAFLALTRTERSSVETHTTMQDTKMLAEGAHARAISDVFASLLTVTNPYINELVISRNLPDLAGNLSTNFYSTADYLSNLQFDARVPVYVRTNTSFGPLDYRFFLDFNRNRWFEDFVPGQGGDPQWLGVLENPTQPHSSSNRFVGRIAYVIQPAGKSLDINTMYNHAKGDYSGGAVAANEDGFARNHGFGPWEFNLSAFLYDLNTNIWNTYTYDIQTNPVTGLFLFPNSGTAFDAARDILRFRYQGGSSNLSDFASAYGNAAANIFTNDNTSGYATVPLWTTRTLPTNEMDDASLPWHGSPNPIRFYDLQDVFNPNALYYGPTFAARLLFVSRNSNNDYDRRTFYRLAAQLTTDSGPPPLNKVSLNYDNYYIFNGQTNFVDWVPEDFFRRTVDILLQRHLGRSISVDTNTPPGTLLTLWPTNEYTPEVHRLIQVAANIYDATRTNRYNPSGPDTNYLPTVFRPVFVITNTGSTNELKLLTYMMETNSANARNPANYYNARNAAALGAGTNYNIYVYDVPVVIGARKGFPGFNEFGAQSAVLLTRKMEVQKQGTNQPVTTLRTNAMIVMGITNQFYIEGWNSYTSLYTRTLRVYTTNLVSATVTTTNGTTIWPQGGSVTYALPTLYNGAIMANPTILAGWAGWTTAQPTNSFRTWYSPYRFMPTNQQFYVNPAPHFQPVGIVTNFEYNAGYPIPEWYLNITNVVHYIAVDDATDRIVDMVYFDSLSTNVHLAQLLMNDPDAEIVQLWNTNRQNNSSSALAPTLGHLRQLGISLGTVTTTPQYWTSYTLQPTTLQQKNNGIDTFRRFIGLTPLFNPATPYPMVTNMQAPYNPTTKLYIRKMWQANDPLVHYTMTDISDLMQIADSPLSKAIKPPTSNLDSDPTFRSNGGVQNERYQPWGTFKGVGTGSQLSTYFTYDWMVKDPLVRRSDDWDFPGGKFGNIGWLGRVHRGTPWQTMYLKAAVADTNEWAYWAGSYYTHPTNDWFILDNFTVSPDFNVSRGLLSVNQTNYAAWSAALSGILVMTNIDLYSPSNSVAVIDPNSPQLWEIYTNINLARNNLNNQFPGGVFTNIGQILAVPQLSVGNYDANGQQTPRSPFLEMGLPPSAPPFTPPVQPQSLQEQNALSDEMYERIPQQLMSLLKVEDSPRIVVYAFGQSLKPAERSIVLTPGPTRGVCTNYQVTGEVVIRSVVRIDGSFLDPINNPPRAVVESYNVLKPTDY